MSAPSAEPLRIESRADLGAALRWGFAQAIERDARRIVCVDPDWSDWPWEDPALLERLAGWFKRPQRRLVLLADSFDEVPRRFPRFTAWRRPWMHAIEAWSPAEGFGGALTTLLVDDDGVRVELFDHDPGRGLAAIEARQAALARERVDAILQRCVPAFPGTDLGL